MVREMALQMIVLEKVAVMLEGLFQYSTIEILCEVILKIPFQYSMLETVH